MLDYSAIYDGPDDDLVAVVCWNHPSKGTAERINGEWVPMDDIQLDSINMKRIDDVTEGVIALTDKADQSRSDLTRTDVMPFVIPREGHIESTQQAGYRGRRVTSPALRQTMAVIALSSGAADVAVVQKLLGHNSAATLGVYRDEIREELTMAVLRNPVTIDR